MYKNYKIACFLAALRSNVHLKAHKFGTLLQTTMYLRRLFAYLFIRIRGRLDVPLKIFNKIRLFISGIGLIYSSHWRSIREAFEEHSNDIWETLENIGEPSENHLNADQEPSDAVQEPSEIMGLHLKLCDCHLKSNESHLKSQKSHQTSILGIVVVPSDTHFRIIRQASNGYLNFMYESH